MFEFIRVTVVGRLIYNRRDRKILFIFLSFLFFLSEGKVFSNLSD